jgi:hypothetical protein
MSQQAVKQEGRPDSGSKSATPEEEAATTYRDVPYLLSQMTFKERVRAYEKGSFSRRELSIAAARQPDAMPMLNGEFEHIAVFSADYLD